MHYIYFHLLKPSEFVVSVYLLNYCLLFEVESIWIKTSFNQIIILFVVLTKFKHKYDTKIL